jgi:2'-5' RNA ligase
MKIQAIYDGMWAEFRLAARNGTFELDSNILNPNDTRRGITALAYLDNNSAGLCNDITTFMADVKAIAPYQYFYPKSDIHLTLLSVISCVEDFKLSTINKDEYVTIFQEVMQNSAPIEVHFKGITASPSCLVIQGFPLNEQLNEIRDQLRTKFKDSGLRVSIDSRYKQTTAHLSIVRFQHQIQNSELLLSLCQRYRQHDFGSVRFNQSELVFNNWYQNLSETQSLSTYTWA